MSSHNSSGSEPEKPMPLTTAGESFTPLTKDDREHAFDKAMHSIAIDDPSLLRYTLAKFILRYEATLRELESSASVVQRQAEGTATASFFIPTSMNESEGTIASEILKATARMRKDGSFAKGDCLCWSPEQLELLAMFAINAKNELASRAHSLGETPAAPVWRDIINNLPPAATDDDKSVTFGSRELTQLPLCWLKKWPNHPVAAPAGTHTFGPCQKRKEKTAAGNLDSGLWPNGPSTTRPLSGRWLGQR
jgi:hypothetical protein